MKANIYQLKVRLKHISPMIWRRVLVADYHSIADLHHIMQILMHWSNDYLHQFTIFGTHYGIGYDGGPGFRHNPYKIKLNDLKLRVNEKFLYEYNFFSNWEFEIRVEKIIEEKPNTQYPFCLSGSYSSPPEDCGGPTEFMKMLDDNSEYHILSKLCETICNFKKLKNKDSSFIIQDLEEMAYWYNIKKFNKKQANSFLKMFSDGNPEWKCLLYNEAQHEI